ncbi:hypothetical protein X474_18685 [Dethiosulfatarculus sandiegensis]|uniref:Uncharacterized protein n=1 Tax=Dethiosulfatarculus sandiegensis TaxID=1429043 RepID=A0A0D2HQ82_9BACT|nr:hypothetical protein X474_18685 [Dethiosulfatarculus sandiegensis]
MRLQDNLWQALEMLRQTRLFYERSLSQLARL